ncbi:MAG: glutaredoxin family protein [Miltoncostaeaceae bacterium]
MPRITVYDAPDCWKCVELKQHLDRLGVAYESITVRGSPEARAEMVQAMGEPPLIPMIVDGDVAVWDRRRIARYLDETYGDGGGSGPSYREMPTFMGGYCSIEQGCTPEAP